MLIHSYYESFNVIEFLNRADDECKYAIVVTCDRERATVTHTGFPRNAEWYSFRENEGWFRSALMTASFVPTGPIFFFRVKAVGKFLAAKLNI